MLFVKQLVAAYVQQLNTLVMRENMCVLESEIMNLFSFIVDMTGQARHVSASDNGERSVTTGMIQAQALKILPNGIFSVSIGWFDRFLKRQRLTVHRITTSGHELPRDALIHINKFLTECEPYMQMGFDRCHTLSWEDCHFNRFFKVF